MLEKLKKKKKETGISMSQILHGMYLYQKKIIVDLKFKLIGCLTFNLVAV